jgi:Protein of unknown function TPD sequence-motif
MYDRMLHAHSIYVATRISCAFLLSDNTRSADVHEVNCMQTLIDRLRMPRTNMITEEDIRSIRAGAVRVKLINDGTATTDKRLSSTCGVNYDGAMNDDTYDDIHTRTEMDSSNRCYGYSSVPAAMSTVTTPVLSMNTELYDCIMNGSSGTPDILLQQPIYYYGTPIHWIEAKVRYFTA